MIPLVPEYDRAKALNKIIGWKAWYGDGGIYTSKDFKWVDIPVNNFQYLKVFYDKNTNTFAGLDLYCITQDHEEIERLINEDPRNIKIGQLMNSLKEFQDFEKQIEADKEIITEMI